MICLEKRSIWFLFNFLLIFLLSQIRLRLLLFLEALLFLQNSFLSLVQEPSELFYLYCLLNNVIFSPHRAGALESAFKEMGDLVINDLKLINKGLPPRLCKKAIKETVGHLKSKPVLIN